MSQTSLVFDEIEVDVTGFFTTHHRLLAEGGLLGEFVFPAFSNEGVFQSADGRELLMRKVRWLGSEHELRESGVVRGRGDRRGMLRQDMMVQVHGQEYTLEREGIFSRGWYLYDSAGVVLLEIQPRGLLRQGACLTVSGVLDVDLIAFAYYLVHVRWQEDSAAAAAS